ncbi:DUF3426 domain-containing protein [Desulfonatronum thioautotrophicum]|uniref:DUF3426 domain-containing protein n=1 Tax=Desulfonatronum thioautotrophicum TaxID=617001 RepID=UPI0005EBAEDD|nr:DUF3426 domain-containing protein [Desulfonatronum thioautotrophicum]
MLIQCPNCDTKYNLDEAVLGPDGSKVRCIRCGHVFFVAPSGEVSALAPEPPREHDLDQDFGTDFDWLDDEAPGKAGDKEDPSSPDKGGERSKASSEREISLEIQASEEPRNKIMTYVVLGLVALTLALALVLYGQQAMDSVSSWFGSPDTTEAEEQRFLGPDEVQLISLQNVRQYFVSNEKIGQLFVIEGKARNDFPMPMELFRIEASLFDGDGQVVESRDFLAGNTVSLFQLQIMTEQELEAALSARVGILTNNTNVRPGMDVQFMVVFPNPPEIVQEYGLRVIGAQHPPG